MERLTIRRVMPALLVFALAALNHASAAAQDAGGAVRAASPATAVSDDSLLRLRAAVEESLGKAAPDPIAAAGHFTRELECYRAVHDQRREAMAIGQWSNWLINREDFGRADSVLRVALDLRRALGDQRLIGNSLNDLGTTLVQRRKFNDALLLLREAIAIRAVTRQDGQRGTSCGWLGMALEGAGQRDSAEAYFRLALELTAGAGEPARELDVLVNYSAELATSGSVDSAIALSERAVRRARDLGKGDRERKALVNLATALQRKGLYRAAIETSQSGYELARSAGDIVGAAGFMNLLGRTWNAIPDTREARRALERASAALDSLGGAERLRWMIPNNLAMASRLAGRSDAGECAHRAYRAAVAQSDTGGMHDVAVTLGQIAQDARRYSEMVRWFRLAAACGRVSEATCLEDTINLGWASIFLGDLTSAGALFERALVRAKADRDDGLAWPALDGLGECAERRGDYPEAVARYRSAAAIIDSLRVEAGGEQKTVSFVAGRMQAYEALVHLLNRIAPLYPDSGYRELAFRYAEHARARSLKDLLEANGLLSTHAETPGPGEIMPRLAADEALVFYSMGDSSSSMWVVRNSGWHWWCLPARAVLRPRIVRLLRAWSSPDRAATNETASESYAMYRSLLGPATHALAGVRRLRIAPDGELAQMPFEALRVRPAVGVGDAGAPEYAVQRWVVSYVASTEALFETVRPPGGPEVFVVADPAFGSLSRAGARAIGLPPLAPLHGTRAEADALRKLVKPGDLHVLTGPGATAARVLGSGWLERARLIHLATHGDANAEDVDRSGLWLAADSTGRPTRLTVGDILAMHSRAETVTLSACESGLGRLERGEGVLGLARAFLAGGARTVVMSLWDADDSWTAELMRSYYESMLKEGIEPDLALARAKRDLIAHTVATSPYFWAPFVLTGNAKKPFAGTEH